MDLDEKLSNAFNAWSEARRKLGELRAALSGGRKGGQLAASPDAANLARRIEAQEQACRTLFADLVAIADERDAELERRRIAGIQQELSQRRSP